MSKSVLVIDTPTSCWECKCSCHGSCGDPYAICMLATAIFGEFTEIPRERNIATWCPLKSLPDKNKAPKVASGYELGYEDGWNKCLAEITRSEVRWRD